MRPKPTSLKTSLLTLGVLLAVSACGKDEPVLLESSALETDSTDGADTTDSFEETDLGTGGGGNGSVARPGSTTPPSTPSTPVGPSPFARICETDGDCADGLRCMQADTDEWLGGGPPHGYCTADCYADPNVCIQEDPSAVCLQVTDTEAFCMQGCAPGPGADKCQGRGDVACDGASIGVGFCRPMCRSDEDCDGRLCDVGSGACADELPEGDPIGAECDPDAAESTCQTGLCLPVTETFASCTGWCNLSEIGCGSDNTMPENPGEPICTFSAIQGSGPSDLGFCNQRCDCDGDCLHPDALCLIVSEDIQAVLGTQGLCVDPEYPDDDPAFTLGLECPEGRDQPMDVDAGGGGDNAPDASPPEPAMDASSGTDEPPVDPAPVEASVPDAG